MKLKFQQAVDFPNSAQGEKIEIGIAATENEKREIYRLRYHIYVEEMHRQPVKADHRRRILTDEMDTWAYLLYAKVGSEFVGTMRVNIGLIKEYPQDLAQLLLMDRFKGFCQESGYPLVAFSSKLMVSPPYRNSPALHLLSAKGYELYCDHHVQFNFGGCNFYLLRLYEQFGCRRFGRNFIDPGYGMLTPFILLVNDTDHLRAVRSPFIRIARKRAMPNKGVTDWFYQEFPESTSVINSQLTSPEEMWSFLCNRLGTAPQTVMPFLRGLSEREASIFLYNCGVFVHCYPHDHIITNGLVSDELNVLVSGTLISFDKAHSRKYVISPGESFGANGLFDSKIQTADIKAAATSEILVVSRQYFSKFSRTKPDIAAKIVDNLSDKIKMAGGR